MISIKTKWSREQLLFSILSTLKPYSSAQKAPSYQTGQGDLPPLQRRAVGHAHNKAAFLLQNFPYSFSSHLNSG